MHPVHEFEEVQRYSWANVNAASVGKTTCYTLAERADECINKCLSVDEWGRILVWYIKHQAPVVCQISNEYYTMLTLQDSQYAFMDCSVWQWRFDERLSGVLDHSSRQPNPCCILVLCILVLCILYQCPLYVQRGLTREYLFVLQDSQTVRLLSQTPVVDFVIYIDVHCDWKEALLWNICSLFKIAGLLSQTPVVDFAICSSVHCERKEALLGDVSSFFQDV